MHEILKKIRNDLRLSMSGPVASSMRDKGINYRMNFGVGIPRIIEISKKYEPGKELAEKLWSEDVRELKILGTMLYPAKEFSRQKADEWVLEISNQELREQVCKNLFQNLDFAGELVYSWTKSIDTNTRATGYWLFARLCITGSPLTDSVNKEDLLAGVIADLKNDSVLMRQSALNSLKFYGRLSEQNAISILNSVSSFKISDNSVENEIYGQLKFEFGMFD